MADEDLRRLVEAIVDYLEWVTTMKADERHRPLIRDSLVLLDFLRFATRNDTPWKALFTVPCVTQFAQVCRFTDPVRTLVALSGYLSLTGKISQPLRLSRRILQLPDPFEPYLHRQSHRVSRNQLGRLTGLLARFHGYLERQGIALGNLKIEDLNHFLAELKVAESTRHVYRSYLRGFLSYVYRERRGVNKDLAALLVGPRRFSEQKPPKFLRPQEVQRLFASLPLGTRSEIRTYAIVHLAYSLGLRPAESSHISLDDISFSRRELTLSKRKGLKPITLPLPEQTIKAIALYLHKVRAKSPSRRLFLTFFFPYPPMTPGIVGQYITKAMRQAGLPSTAYWLRHTYAQNLLHLGQSMYEIKEMLGHDRLYSTQKYLYVDTDLMRKVLFHETL